MLGLDSSNTEPGARGKKPALQGNSIEFEFWGRLVFADAARLDVCLVIIFAADGDAGKTTKNGKLTDMVEHIGDGTLEKFFGGDVELVGAGEIVVETLEGVEETLDFIGPGQGCGIMPSLLAFGHGQGPVEQIADVREDLHRSAAVLTGLKVDVALRGVANGFAGTIGYGGEGVTKKIAGTDGVWGVHSGSKLAVSRMGWKEFCG